MWPGAVGLSDYLCDVWGETRLAGMPILELGCGTGLVSLIAANLGGDVTASDIAVEALRLVERAAEDNRVTLQTAILDWENPKLSRRYPMVLGADVMYYEPLFDGLLDCLDRSLAPGGLALFSDPIRSPGTLFLQMLRERGFVFEQSLRTVDVRGRESIVGIYRIWRRGEEPIG
ncbi:MAG: methyltransferase domain-containing protein [Myxococcales bacterium]|nr:methyltransferase domain-containing protein [Myxococcales bacterium]